MRFLIFSHLFIAFCAVMMTLETIVVFNLDVQKNLLYLSVVFFSTLIAYNLKGILTTFLPEKSMMHSEKEEWTVANRKPISVLFVVSFIIAIVSIFFLKIETIFILCALGLLSMGYSWLREIPYIKTFLVAAVWTLVVAYLPFIETKSFIDVKWNWILSDFLFLFSLALLFDIKDLKVDHQRKVNTIPLLIGVPNTILLSVGLLFLRFLLIVNFSGNNFYLFKVIIITFLTISFISIFVKKTSSEYFYMKWIDGLMLFKSIVSILFVTGEFYF